MKVTYEHKPAMILIGYSTSIRPEEGYQKCPEFWDKEYARKYAWLSAKPEHPGLAGVVSHRRAEIHGQWKRHAGGLLSRRYAKSGLRVRHLGADL